MVSKRILLLVIGSLAVILASPVIAFSFGGKQTPTPHKVRVCQNKDCCRQWKHAQNLPETLQDLLPPDANVEMEVSGCLSQCGKGPNLMVQNNNNHQGGSSQTIVQGVTGPLSLVDELQDQLGISVPSKLVAAVTVMEKATRGRFVAKDRC